MDGGAKYRMQGLLMMAPMLLFVAGMGGLAVWSLISEFGLRPVLMTAGVVAGSIAGILLLAVMFIMFLHGLDCWQGRSHDYDCHIDDKDFPL